jgi:hypothetical protein
MWYHIQCAKKERAKPSSGWHLAYGGCWRGNHLNDWYGRLETIYSKQCLTVHSRLFNILR